MTEQIVDLVKAYPVGRNKGSLVVTIPKRARARDEKGRLIYEPI